MHLILEVFLCFSNSSFSSSGSYISPTISSNTSSNVTKPVVPPYSSTQMANVRSLRKRSEFRRVIVSGTKNGLSQISCTCSGAKPSSSEPTFLTCFSNCFMVTTPTMLSKRLLYTGIRLNCVSDHSLCRLEIGSWLSMQVMSTNGVITSLTFLISRLRTLLIICPSSECISPLSMASRKMMSSSSSDNNACFEVLTDTPNSLRNNLTTSLMALDTG
mmetsp:Transcript_16912/g.39377  ORF Transcript_16912/g.39377 Transcript_16912/m.39377 type:complete len:216 (-) Transcript_16912:886-1533(-)